MVLMIDNYDSFTWNLVQYLQALGAEVKVVRNDELSVAQVDALAPERIVISPGPCTPNEAGVSVEVIRQLGARVPILGVCLGHQSLGQAYGGDVVRAKTIMHGKTSRIRHAARACSPACRTATRRRVTTRWWCRARRCRRAWRSPRGPSRRIGGSFDEIMGLRHREHPVEGVQFHPESILTEHGHALLKNFLER